ncbi:MAG: hypothetical protein ACTSR8_14410 [Promethearchaeota archaeon]
MFSSLLTKVKEQKQYGIGFTLITILYTILYIIVIYWATFLMLIPIRIDFIAYLLMGGIIFFFGFHYGYKKLLDNKKEKIDSGIFYGLLYFVAAMQMGVCVFDNIIIIFRVFGPEHLDLNAPMEIQFIFIYFLTISQYRFFTLIYLFSGLSSLLYIKKRSTLILGFLFTFYIYSSLFLAFIFNLPILIPYLQIHHIIFYIWVNLIIGVIFFILFFIIKLKLDKVF